MPSGDNRAILAVAGGRKTEEVIRTALSDATKRTLITTYTNENLRQIVSRIEAHTGVLPPHIRASGWFSFLINEAIRPYQHSVFGEVGLVRRLNFEGERNRFAKREQRSFFLDRHNDVFRGSVADLACAANAKSEGLVVQRLEALFDRIFIDEVQDLVGYDLDFIDLLFKSQIEVTVVGDPRQYTYATNHGTRNTKYRGAGFVDWIDERVTYCQRVDRHVSARCEQGTRSHPTKFTTTSRLTSPRSCDTTNAPTPSATLR